MVTKELIYSEYEALCTKYKKLLPPEKLNDGWKIEGEFDVVGADGYRWDTYGIRILIPPGFPYDLPILMETSKKIEPTLEFHNSKGFCCLATHAIIYNALGTPISLLKWMNRFVHDFLANHVIKIRDKSYAKGEYPHYEEGMIVGYKEIFGLATDAEVLQRLKLICGVVSIGRNTRCFCGNDKNYKRCFLLNPKGHYHNIPISVLNKERIEIDNYLHNRITLLT
jgi:hypothetical protein